MRRVWQAVLIVLVLAIALAAAAQRAPALGDVQRVLSPPDAAKQEQAIRAELQASADEWNQNNLDGYMRVYWNSPELTFSSGANTTRGYAAALDRYKRNYQSQGREMGKLDYSGVTVDMLCNDTAFVRGSWRLRQSGGKQPHGVFTLIMKKRSEGWRIVHDHSSGE